MSDKRKLSEIFNVDKEKRFADLLAEYRKHHPESSDESDADLQDELGTIVNDNDDDENDKLYKVDDVENAFQKNRTLIKKDPGEFYFNNLSRIENKYLTSENDDDDDDDNEHQNEDNVVNFLNFDLQKPSSSCGPKKKKLKALPQSSKKHNQTPTTSRTSKTLDDSFDFDNPPMFDNIPTKKMSTPKVNNAMKKKNVENRIEKQTHPPFIQEVQVVTQESIVSVQSNLFDSGFLLGYQNDNILESQKHRYYKKNSDFQKHCLDLLVKKIVRKEASIDVYRYMEKQVIKKLGPDADLKLILERYPDQVLIVRFDDQQRPYFEFWLSSPKNFITITEAISDVDEDILRKSRLVLKFIVEYREFIQNLPK